MSGADSSQGPGWWQASDGKWYPPEQRPGGSPTPSPTPAASPSPSASPASPTSSPYATPGPSPIPSAQPLGATGGSGGEQKGFFARLFDMSFTSFITPSIIKILFILGIILISIAALFFLIAGAASADDGGIFLVIIAPIYWLFGVVYTRVLLEVIIVFFRIEANTRKT